MLPQIRMEQTFAQLGYDITKPRQEIQQPHAELNMHQELSQLFIETTKPAVYIDQTEAFADAGSKKLSRLIAEYAEKGRQAVLEGITRIAQEGLTLRSIETGAKGAKLKQIAKQRFYKAYPSSQIDFIPKYGSVKMQGVPGTLEINWKIGGVEMNPVTHRPIHNYQQGRIDFYLTQKNYLRFWVESDVDTRL